MIKQEKQKQLKITQKCRATFVLSLVLMVTFVLFKMILSNRAATWGHTLDQIKKETLMVKNENMHLKGELAKQTGGLNYLAEQAKKDGFTDKPVFKYFVPDVIMAQKTP